VLRLLRVLLLLLLLLSSFLSFSVPPFAPSLTVPYLTWVACYCTHVAALTHSLHDMVIGCSWHFDHGAGGPGFTFGAVDMPKALAALKEIGGFIREEEEGEPSTGASASASTARNLLE
jgi:hypothetical protein